MYSPPSYSCCCSCREAAFCLIMMKNAAILLSIKGLRLISIGCWDLPCSKVRQVWALGLDHDTHYQLHAYQLPRQCLSGIIKSR